MHELLKNMLTDMEDIWIYDEPNRCSILRKIFKSGRVLYSAMVFDGFDWHCIDIQETDVHGAQIMYECLKNAVNALSV